MNFVARRERSILNWLCAHMPAAVTPDGLTALSVVGSLVVLVGYVASRYNPVFLWLACFGLVLNWFGDSLDGSLARFRRIERPAYGYFLDHTVDALNNLMIMVGIGLTAQVRMDTALFALVGYYLLCMYVFINNHLSGVFRLSFLGFGPTELRIALILINAAMFTYPPLGWLIADQFVSVYDAILFGAGLAFVVVFGVQVVAGVRALRQTTSRAVSATFQSPFHSLSAKVSSSSK